MSAAILESQLFDELKTALDRGLASGELMTSVQIEQQITLFRGRFGPAVLRGLDGEALLRLMHGRESSESRCLAYWLEFKNDDEFAGNRFGGIGGGSALKFGIFFVTTEIAISAANETLYVRPLRANRQPFIAKYARTNNGSGNTRGAPPLTLSVAKKSTQRPGAFDNRDPAPAVAPSGLQIFIYIGDRGVGERTVLRCKCLKKLLCVPATSMNRGRRQTSLIAHI